MQIDGKTAILSDDFLRQHDINHDTIRDYAKPTFLNLYFPVRQVYESIGEQQDLDTSVAMTTAHIFVYNDLLESIRERFGGDFYCLFNPNKSVLLIKKEVTNLPKLCQQQKQAQEFEGGSYRAEIYEYDESTNTLVRSPQADRLYSEMNRASTSSDYEEENTER